MSEQVNATFTVSGEPDHDAFRRFLDQAKNIRRQSDRFTFQDLEAYTLNYLTAKLPDEPQETLMEIATTLTYKYALANANSIAERDREWKRDMQRWNRRQAQPPQEG